MLEVRWVYLYANRMLSLSPTTLSLIALGGAMGSVMRFSISQIMTRWMGASFPYGTLTVNMVGSLLMGALMAWLTASPRYNLQALLAVGFLGGFTTFSAFAFDSLMLYQRGDALPALLGYISVSVMGSLLAVAIGWYGLKGML
jgi:CrcB protein